MDSKSKKSADTEVAAREVDTASIVSQSAAQHQIETSQASITVECKLLSSQNQKKPFTKQQFKRKSQKKYVI